MKIIDLLGALAVLSLMMVPAFSQPDLKGCTCMPGDCRELPVENCCSKASDNCISQSCTCPEQIMSYQGIEYYDPGYSHFGKSGSRSSTISASRGQVSPRDARAFISPQAGASSAGPPDPDVVEYLPPSARQVLLVLASCGPLTQKDIINKTDLPPRTVRYALDRLKGEEMLQERFCFSDARQSLYSLFGTDTKQML
jgi:hypothetical protein